MTVLSTKFTCIGSHREKPAPNVGQRQMCYVARDAFYECKAKHNEEEAPCEELKRAYHSSCLTSWVGWTVR